MDIRCRDRSVRHYRRATIGQESHTLSKKLTEGSLFESIKDDGSAYFRYRKFALRMNLSHDTSHRFAIRPSLSPGDGDVRGEEAISAISITAKILAADLLELR